MADEPDDELLLTDELHEDVQTGEPADTDDVTIHIDGEDEPDETPLVKQLREKLVDANRRAAELTRATPVAQRPPDPGKKPNLWEDAEGDEDKYDALKEAYDKRVQAQRDFDARAQEQQQTASRAFERQKAAYLARAAKVRDVNMDEAEQAVAQTLSPEWVGAIIEASPVAERVIAALHKYPAEMQKVLEQPADWRRMRALWDLEQKVNKPMVAKQRPPAPEADTIQRGSAPLTGVTNKAAYEKRLADLEKKATATGNRNEIQAFKRQYKGKF